MRSREEILKCIERLRASRAEALVDGEYDYAECLGHKIDGLKWVINE